MTNKHQTRNQPHYSEDEDYFSQNQQRYSTNQLNKNWNIDQPDPIYQPDLFQSYTRNEQTRQTRHKPTSDTDFQSHKPTFSHLILQIHRVINQLKCKMKSHYHIIYNNMK